MIICGYRLGQALLVPTNFSDAVATYNYSTTKFKYIVIDHNTENLNILLRQSCAVLPSYSIQFFVQYMYILSASLNQFAENAKNEVALIMQA